MKKKYLDPLIQFFGANTLYVVIILAAIFLSLAYALFDENDAWRDIFKSLGLTFVSGGVFAVIVKSEQFSKIFHDELRNIIYSNEHLSQRKDLDVIWDNVTKAMCNQKFRLISKRLHDGVKGCYLPINHEFYYKNHNVELEIKFDKENPDYIKVIECTKTTVISENSNPISFPFSSSIPLFTGEEDYTTYELSSLSVNKDKKDPTNLVTIEKKGGELKASCIYKLEGKTRYDIVREEIKRYHLKSNSMRHHNAIWLYDNFFLDVTYPKTLEVKFMQIGVVNNWEQEDKSTDSYGRMKASYKGLIFQKQGFILHLNKI